MLFDTYCKHARLMIYVDSVSGGGIVVVVMLCSTWSFRWRRYSQWKKEIKQITRIVETTDKMYTGTRKIQEKLNHSFSKKIFFVTWIITNVIQFAIFYFTLLNLHLMRCWRLRKVRKDGDWEDTSQLTRRETSIMEKQEG